MPVTQKLILVATEALTLNAIQKNMLIRSFVAANLPNSVFSMLTAAVVAPKETLRAFSRINRASQ